MARIEYSNPANANERTREILGKNRNANIFRMMAHSPSYLEQYCRLGGAIRHKGELDPVVRELAITRDEIPQLRLLSERLRKETNMHLVPAEGALPG